MKVKFWGVRGSIASPGPRTVHFGGNTSCYELVSREGTRVILDAGTGLRELGLVLAEQMPLRAHLLISHTHWDHIQGFPFFTPAFYAGNSIQLYGPRHTSDLADVIRRQMDRQFFPVEEAELKSSLSYRNVGEESFRIGDLLIRARFTHHPVTALCYRIEEGSRAVVYSGDSEPYDQLIFQTLKGRPDCSPEELKRVEAYVHQESQRYIDFCRDADLLIHDAQYTQAEYLDGKRGWGHSPMEAVVRLGRAAGVKHLVMSHHDPTREDDVLLGFEQTFRQECAQLSPHMALSFAAEGQEYELSD